MSGTRGRPPAQSDQEYATRTGEYQQGGYPQGGYQQAGYAPPQRQAGYAGQRRRGGGAALAGSILAGVLMIISGALGFLYGLAMVIRGGFYTVHHGYAYLWTTHGWGYTQLIIGGLVFFAGIGVMAGMTWARIVGVMLATVSAVTAFLTIVYYPLWSILVIAVDVFVIWALVVRGHRRSRDRDYV